MNFFIGLKNALIPSLILWAIMLVFFIHACDGCGTARERVISDYTDNAYDEYFSEPAILATTDTIIFNDIGIWVHWKFYYSFEGHPDSVDVVTKWECMTWDQFEELQEKFEERGDPSRRL